MSIDAQKEEINNQDPDCYYTPLHLAIARNKFDFMIVLLTHPLSNLELEDHSKKTIKALVKISPFIDEMITASVLNHLDNLDTNSSLDFLDFIKNEDKFPNLNLPSYPHMDARTSDEQNLTRILIDFRRWGISNIHRPEIFLRHDDQEVVALAHFLLSAETARPLRERIQKIDLKKYKIRKKINKKNIGKHERIICFLLDELKDIFSESLNMNRCLERLFFSMRWISSEALKDKEESVEDRILSLVFLRFINPLLKQSDRLSMPAKIRLIKSLQRTLSGEDEKGGELEALGDFFAARNENGEDARITITIFKKIFYKHGSIYE